MMNAAQAFYDGARAYKRVLTGEALAGLDDQDMEALRDATERRWTRKVADITAKVALELISHEAIVQEAYKDSVGVWTWGIGVTNASGHNVDRYKDNPQPVRKCLEIFIWLLRERYLTDVLKAFPGHSLTESQLGGALSFHYNTGAILRADWVDLWLAGKIGEAKASFMNWKKPLEIIPRRQKERDLFFDGKWSSDGKATVYPVRKPSYTPDWGGAKRVDVSAILKELLA